mgnify:CR=1 FL=1
MQRSVFPRELRMRFTPRARGNTKHALLASIILLFFHMGEKAHPFHIILACTLDSGIGKAGTIPWYIPEDMQRFRNITQTTEDPKKQNMVIMGRKTWESLPRKPLFRRRNVVVSRSLQNIEGADCVTSLEDALQIASKDPTIENVFVMGGAQIYNEALKHPLCDTIYVTMINASFACDIFFDDSLLRDRFELVDLGDVQNQDDIEYAFAIFRPQSSL